MATLRVPLYPAEQAAKPMKCAVTGATGYVAGALVQRLLAGGHVVHATVRNPSEASKLAHLTDLPGATERLKFFKADLLDSVSFDEALKGCNVVFHTASPFILGVKEANAQETLIKPAVTGVESVLGAVNRIGDADTVVMTSSIVATCGDNWEHGKDHVLTEADWNNSSSEKYLPYPYSKTLAERKAWEINESQTGPKKWKLSTINPGFVLGPPLSLYSKGTSVSFGLDFVAGKFKAGVPNSGMGVVDVDDVAAAHVLAALVPEASGRFLCVSESTDFPTFLKAAEQELEKRGDKKKLVGGTLPKWVLWIAANVFKVMPWDTMAASIDKPFKIDNSKIKNVLGMNFIAPGTMMADMVQKIEELQKKEKETAAN